jgi:hypothetical protein
MAVYRKFYSHVERVGFQSTAYMRVYVTNSAPLQTYTTVADLTLPDLSYFQETYIGPNSFTFTGLTFNVNVSSVSIPAYGPVGPFRYIVIASVDSPGFDPFPYNLDQLVCYYDLGASITMQNGDTFEFNFTSNKLYVIN